MYEPYEEKKTKAREFFERLKDRVQRPIKNIFSYSFRDNKFPFVVVILAVLAIGGLSYTGYASYTAKIAETQSQLVVQEGQINALKEEVGDYETSLAVCNTDLGNRKEMLNRTEADLKVTEEKLTSCNAEFTQLINTSAAIQGAFNDLQNKHTGLENSYRSLECSYAKDKDCDYYTFSNSKILCCGRVDDNFYCGQQFIPTNASNVNRVSEKCQS